jgi:phytoene dehydrogenase-like protein
MLELTIPTMYDPSLAPPGKHIMGIFLQYAPYTLRGTTWDEAREPFYNRVVDVIEEYVPNIRSIIDRQAGAHAARSGAPLRHHRRQHLPRRDGPRSDVRHAPGGRLGALPHPGPGLYLCGSGAHPGGGVMGAPGYNAAREMLKDRI